MSTQCALRYISLCGQSGHYKPECTDDQISLVPIKTCKKSSEKHSSQLHSCSEHNFDLPENLLILYRSGIFTVDSYALNLHICPNHRDELGIHWVRRQRTCQSPFHKGKAKADRGIQARSSRELWFKRRINIPVGAGIYVQLMIWNCKLA